MVMKQQVFKKENSYGNMRKAILTTWERKGKKVYSVAFFKNAELLTCDEGVVDFAKRKDAMYSIQCHFI
jgi:uncharacterized protein YkuJ